MKAYAVGKKDNPEQIQDSRASERYGKFKNTDLLMAIYWTEESAIAAANFYSQIDRFDSGLTEPYEVHEVEITYNKKVHTSTFGGEDEEEEEEDTAVLTTSFDSESGKKVEHCGHCGAEWLADNRLAGEGCPDCGRILVKGEKE